MAKQKFKQFTDLLKQFRKKLLFDYTRLFQCTEQLTKVSSQSDE